MPTEAQWEFACRSGTATRFCYGEDESSFLLKDYAWFDDNADEVGEDYAHPVGVKKPNAWGLYDMHGNVWEWCQDWYGGYPTGSVTDPAGSRTGGHRVHRGGGWNSSAWLCRSANRNGLGPTFRDDDLGFRVALPVQRR